MALLSAAAIATAGTTGILLNQPATAAPTQSPVASAVVTDHSHDRSGDDSADRPTPPKDAPLEKSLNIDFQYQTQFYNCGPAAVRNALTAHGIDLAQDDLARPLHTTFNGTDSAEDTTRGLNEATHGNFYRTTMIHGQSATPRQMDQLQVDVVHAISHGYAVVANIAGGATDTAGVWHEFPGGHYIAITGYSDDGRLVEVADSSGMFGPASYRMSTINLANWIATRGYSA